MDQLLMPGKYLDDKFWSDIPPTDGQVIQWDGAAGKWRPTTVSTMKAPVVLTPASLYSIGTDLSALALAAPASAAWPTANKAIFVPFWLPESVTLTQIFWLNGAAVSGNIDVGIYNSSGTRQISTGSTGQVGINSIQNVDVVDTILASGNYYLAMALDNITGAVLRWSISAVTGISLGLAEQTSAFALPATATLATFAAAMVPLMGFTVRSFV